MCFLYFNRFSVEFSATLPLHRYLWFCLYAFEHAETYSGQVSDHFVDDKAVF